MLKCITNKIQEKEGFNHYFPPPTDDQRISHETIRDDEIAYINLLNQLSHWKKTQGLTEVGKSHEELLQLSTG